VPEDERHALAALCLHGQLFGFTWEDVRRLRGVFWAMSQWGKNHAIEWAGDEWGESVADRIEALLPPEGA